MTAPRRDDDGGARGSDGAAVAGPSLRPRGAAVTIDTVEPMRASNLLISTMAVALVACAGCASGPERAPAQPTDAPEAKTARPAEAIGSERPAGPPPGPGERGEELLDELAGELSLREQADRAVSSKHLRAGISLYERLEFRRAERELASALAAWAQNKLAEQYLTRCQFVLGKRDRVFATSTEQLVDERSVLVQQKEIEVQRLLDRANAAAATGDLGAAIAGYERVLEELSWLPYHRKDGRALQETTRSRLLEARRAKRTADLVQRERLQKLAFARAQAEADAARDRRDRKVQALLRKATYHINRREYRKAEELADEILLLDPSHGTAGNVRDHAIRGRHRSSQARLASERREQDRRDLEGTREAAVPYGGRRH